MVKDTTEHKWVEWAEDSLHSAGFRRDSRASFVDYGEGWCLSFLCLYQVTTFLAYTRSSEDLLLIPGHQGIPCLYQVKCVIHTSGLGVVGASWAGITLKSDSWAVCVSGAWASAIHACGMILGGE